MSDNVEIELNGETTQVPENWNLTELLESLREKGTPPPRAIAVELNGNIVPHSQYAETRFQNQDHVEVVTLVGGG